MGLASPSEGYPGIKFAGTHLYTWAQLFEGRLALNPGVEFNPGFFFFCSKAFPWLIFSVIFRASNHQLVDKKN